VGERVLVTGATGFIGSHLVDELLWKGYEVAALTRESSDLRWLRGKKVELIEGDLLGKGKLPSLKGFAHIFHLGGATRALRTRDFYRTNHEGTERLIDAARHIRGLKRFVYLSSQAAAGPAPEERPQKEEDLTCPVSPYGKSKLHGEEVVLDCRDKFHVTILRPCAIYGPRDAYMLELFKRISKGYFPLLGKKPIYLSFCYVEDLIQALMLSAQRDHPSGEVFFIADGERYTLDFFANVVSSELHVKLRKIRIPIWVAWFYAAAADGWGLVRRRPAFFHRGKCAEASERNWVCDISKAKKQLGFRPRFRLEAGIKVTLRWYQEKGWL
jgi:nucleoside-diphosphate-sugar epimerase